MSTVHLLTRRRETHSLSIKGRDTMYKIIPENARRTMTRVEIEKEYEGKWVFLTKIQEIPFSAVPVIYADTPMEGREKGIYTPFFEAASATGETAGEMSLLKWMSSISGFYAD